MGCLKDYIFNEIVYTSGCTEPAAVAFAVAKALDFFGDNESVDNINIDLSKNVFKNGVDVGIPGTSKRGNLFAAAIGFVSKKSELGLEILSGIDEDMIEKAESLISSDFFKINCLFDISDIFISVKIIGKNNEVKLIIKGSHTNVVFVSKNNDIILNKKFDEDFYDYFSDISLKDILNFSNNCDDDCFEYVYKKAMNNCDASIYGINNNNYKGFKYVKRLLDCNKDYDEKIIELLVVSASMSRMGGAPVRITSCFGSGNQGIVSLVPIFFYGKKNNLSKEIISKALILSCLITGFIKHKMGKLIPLCGVFYAAGVGASVGLYFLMNGFIDENIINSLIINFYSGSAGVLCDGAKESCAIKSGNAAKFAFECAELMSYDKSEFSCSGISGNNFYDTIDNLNYLNVEGMKCIDKLFINIINNRGDFYEFK